MHQDAHEFLIYVLNTIAENVLDFEKERHKRQQQQSTSSSISQTSATSSVGSDEQERAINNWAWTFRRADAADDASSSSGSVHPQNGLRHGSCESVPSSMQPQAPATTWVHRLFEGVLTNETKCLTCETVSCLGGYLHCSVRSLTLCYACQ